VKTQEGGGRPTLRDEKEVRAERQEGECMAHTLLIKHNVAQLSAETDQRGGTHKMEERVKIKLCFVVGRHFFT